MFDDFDDLTDLLIPREENLSWWKAEHQLWYAVLEQGLERYLTLLSKSSYGRKEKIELEELTDWFFITEETQWLGSFLYICDICKISSVRVRKELYTCLENRAVLEED